MTLDFDEARIDICFSHIQKDIWLSIRGTLDLEGVSGPGDSGGPAFIEKDGILYVAGVISTQTFKGIGEREGLYGILDYYTRVSSYLDWIELLIQKNN